MKTLGLIGGSTWLSTLEYYRALHEGVTQRLGESPYGSKGWGREPIAVLEARLQPAPRRGRT